LFRSAKLFLKLRKSLNFLTTEFTWRVCGGPWRRERNRA